MKTEQAKKTKKNTKPKQAKEPEQAKEPKQAKKTKKERNNINVSLKKRDKALLNSILNNWEKEGCNISSEVCDAIILKNLSDEYPHIQTILSTLSLIESSLKSHKSIKNMKEEEIKMATLSIFNEVITIDIDGNKLTNLIKGVDISKFKIKEESEQEKNTEKESKFTADINNEEHSLEEVALTIEDSDITEKNEDINIDTKKVFNRKNDATKTNYQTSNIIATENTASPVNIDKNTNEDEDDEFDEMFGGYATHSGFQS